MQCNANQSQEADVLAVFKRHGYGVWISLPEFPHLHELNRAIHNLRHRNDFNIGNRCERSIRSDGRTVTRSWYRLLPGRWSELRGKPEPGSRYERASASASHSTAEISPWSERPRALTDNLGRPLPEFALIAPEPSR